VRGVRTDERPEVRDTIRGGSLTEYLFLIAELAAAFAGFTAIVSVLNTRTDSRKRALDVLRLRAMLEASLGTIALALLPTLLREVGLGESAWRWAHGGAAVVVVVLYVAQLRRGFAPEMRSTPGYSQTTANYLAGLGLVGLGCVIAGAVGVGNPAALYLVALTLLLSVAGLQFFRASVSIMGSASG
jgi:hypothetical protein